MNEDALLTGPLEATNEWYAIAKSRASSCAGLSQAICLDFISTMPTNLYGPGDNFDLETSHVVPALIRKSYEAIKYGSEEIEIWGTARHGENSFM